MKIKSPFLTKCAAWLMVRAIKTLYLTIRRDEIVFDPDTIAYHEHVRERYLYCTWHDSIVMPLFHSKPYHMAALVSGHQDGSYLAESMHFLRVTPVRGSSGKQGVNGLRTAVTAAQDFHITITPDGPRGPRRTMKEGIVFLAAKSGNAIVPMAFRVTRSWKISGRWTDLVIPKPFSKITVFLGEPIRVPETLGSEGLQEYTRLVQQRMDDLYARAESDSVETSTLGDHAAPKYRLPKIDPDQQAA
ncbi:MAG: lysophospholipid acyltransferase family protein [Rhodopirellula sp.]|nr:lysophospholipid acyltransferase family protein [Rhodopirellula sp.]